MSSIDNGLTSSTRMPKTMLEETILRVRNRLINLGGLILKKYKISLNNSLKIAQLQISSSCFYIFLIKFLFIFK